MNQRNHEPEVVALVTGKFAEPALRQIARELAEDGRLQSHVIALNIQVAALLTTEWVAKKIQLPDDVAFSRLVLPGYCRGDLSILENAIQVPVERGPQNMHDLPTFFGRQRHQQHGYGEQNIQIIAEINDAAHLSWETMLQMATTYREQGADVIDLGCDPQADRPAWTGVGDTVKRLRDEGFAVSVDSFQVREIADACKAGAELVLSVNSTNRDAAPDWGTEVVVIPDDPKDLSTLHETVEHLNKHSVPFRIDPIIEPIGFGFAESLGRYLQVRKQYPDAGMMMGIGNLSEMTQVDSAGVNALLIGFCQELSIGSVLTTQVINYARNSVTEIDIARRLMHFAVKQRVPPKHLDDRLVMLRDPKLRPTDRQVLDELAAQLTDDNVRIYADALNEQIHAMNKDVHAVGSDPFELFDQLKIDDASHAFYLGYEMAKAVIAMSLHKNYVQDEPLRFGLLTREEVSHYERHKRFRNRKQQ